jgi:hypothetical protein
MRLVLTITGLLFLSGEGYAQKPLAMPPVESTNVTRLKPTPFPPVEVAVRVAPEVVTVPTFPRWENRGVQFNADHRCPNCRYQSPAGQGTWIVRGYNSRGHLHSCPQCGTSWFH